MAFVGLLLLYSLTHTSALSLSISLERERCIKAEGGGDRLNKLAYTMRILYGFGARSDRSVADTGDDRPDVPPSHTPSRSRPVQNRTAYQRRRRSPAASRQENATTIVTADADMARASVLITADEAGSAVSRSCLKDALRAAWRRRRSAQRRRVCGTRHGGGARVRGEDVV